MLFTFLISIVFIAELIITLTIILNLIRLDKTIIAFNETITLSKPGIRDISVLIKNISGQIREFSVRFANKHRENTELFITKTIVKMIAGIILYRLNIKAFKRFKKSKVSKTLAKGLSLLQIVI